MSTDPKKWTRIFMPYAVREMERVRENGTRFVHYCSAESGLAILQSKRMFLRNSVLMNDFSEVAYGADCLSNAYDGPVGERLKAALAAIQADLPEIIEANHNALLADVRLETYLISISEHLGGIEDDLGRLSMWRAYGQKNGVAMIFNNVPFLIESDALKAYTSPVAYKTQDEFVALFDEMVAGVEANLDELKKEGPEFVLNWLTWAFRFAMQSTKHPAFQEEREWRVIYSPTILGRRGELTPQQYERIPTEIRCLGGVPQRVYAIPFQNYPDEGFIGATVGELIDRILIGPTNDGYAIGHAFVSELEAAGVNPAGKVHITGVPLRT